jgi:hypothetical protein
MEDFERLVIEISDRKKRETFLFRDHGHEENIRRSYELVRPGRIAGSAASPRYIWETAQLFLKTRQALESDQVIVMHDDMPAAESPLTSVR